MATAFGAILAVIKAIPIVESWVQRFVAWYVEREAAAFKADVRAAIKKAIDEQDTRDLEKVIGNPNAGEPSNLPGTVIRDSLPGV